VVLKKFLFYYKMEFIGRGTYSMVMRRGDYALKKHFGIMSLNEWIILMTIKDKNVLSGIRYEQIETEKGKNSIVYTMEFCSTSLEQIYKQLKPEVLPKIERECRLGLDALHERGYVHGDVSLSNFLLCRGVVRIADFGLSVKTPDHVVKEIPLYTVSNRPRVNIVGDSLMFDRRSDLWAFRVCVFELRNELSVFEYIESIAVPGTLLHDLVLAGRGQIRLMSRIIKIGHQTYGPQTGELFEFDDVFDYQLRIMSIFYEELYETDTVFRPIVDVEDDPVPLIETVLTYDDIRANLVHEFPDTDVQHLNHIAELITTGRNTYINADEYSVVDAMIQSLQRG
jgi:serine/threonine protein kinase